ncbi:hypothetical protein NFI96_014121 [Prochilodus magdalenae]|nr:hypothetical protein NFI96_014121 [Prochilodus magdalenae]
MQKAAKTRCHTHGQLHSQLTQLKVPASTCQWITTFLTGREQQFADNTTVIGLIHDDESAYSRMVDEVVLWSNHNNLKLNTAKRVEMAVDFRRSPPALPALTVLDRTVMDVESYNFPDTTISKVLKWDCNISSIIKKAQQRMHFLRQLRKFNLSQELMVQFYTATIESVIAPSITAWGNSATKHDIHRLQRIIRSAEKITGITTPWPSPVPAWPVL